MNMPELQHFNKQIGGFRMAPAKLCDAGTGA